jgi:hypothetical protein
MFGVIDIPIVATNRQVCHVRRQQELDKKVVAEGFSNAFHGWSVRCSVVRLAGQLFTSVTNLQSIRKSRRGPDNVRI